MNNLKYNAKPDMISCKHKEIDLSLFNAAQLVILKVHTVTVSSKLKEKKKELYEIESLQTAIPTIAMLYIIFVLFLQIISIIKQKSWYIIFFVPKQAILQEGYIFVAQ